MAITGTSQKLDTYWRDNLSNNMNSDDFLNAVGYHGGLTLLPAQVAGIKPGFREKINEAIDNYSRSIINEIEKLQTNPNIAQAFRGAELDGAIKRLIYAVNDEAHAYINDLKIAEMMIIAQIEELYSSQSNSVSESMGADTSTLDR